MNTVAQVLQLVYLALQIGKFAEADASALRAAADRIAKAHADGVDIPQDEIDALLAAVGGDLDAAQASIDAAKAGNTSS